MKIFISYNRNDRDYASRLYENLKAHGFDAWFYDLLTPGEAFDNTIHRKLEECDAVIAILTPQAISSPTIEAEIRRAKELNKRIIPFLLEDIDHNPLSYLTYLDVRGGVLPSEQLYTSLGSVKLAGDSTTDAPPPEVNVKKKKPKGK
jgi:hypothetical protein